MTYTRKVQWECEREYETLEEAIADEDNMLRESFPHDFTNADLYENELRDESGTPVSKEKIKPP